jgi:hypothetical protein
LYIVERVILGIVWLISLISIWFISKQKIRDATFIYFLTSTLTWPLGLIVVELDLIEYQVAELYKANSTSFSYEYVILPLVCVHFNLFYPATGKIGKKVSYYAAFLTVLTILEYFIERYTLLVSYIKWEWYFTFISLALLLYVVRVLYKCFFNRPEPLSL